MTSQFTQKGAHQHHVAQGSMANHGNILDCFGPERRNLSPTQSGSPGTSFKP
jgi:hypothetical protein